MAYLRHRPRLVQASVFDDIDNTMIACRWKSGTTSREVIDPTTGELEIITTAPEDVFSLLDGHEVILVDYFPESSNASSPMGATLLNTMAIASGEIGDRTEMEMGNRGAHYQPYKFGMALYSSSDAVAYAIFSDLNDRYRGALIGYDYIPLCDSDGDKVSEMEVSSFTFYRDNDGQVPATENLFFGILSIVDCVEE
jgi:hypothetical protein